MRLRVEGSPRTAVSIRIAPMAPRVGDEDALVMALLRGEVMSDRRGSTRVGWPLRLVLGAAGEGTAVRLVAVYAFLDCVAALVVDAPSEEAIDDEVLALIDSGRPQWEDGDAPEALSDLLEVPWDAPAGVAPLHIVE